MNLTANDIENLDKVIYGLTDHNHNYDTIPELLNGWQKFPSHDDPNNRIYRFYESFLVSSNICSVKNGWTINSVVGGFKTLQLDTEGHKIIHYEESVQDYINRTSSSNKGPSSVNIGKVFMGDNIENNHGTIINHSIVNNSLNKILQRLGEEEAQLLKHITNEVEKSGQQDALENMEEFHKEIQKAEPKKSLLKSFWNGISTALPALITNTDKILGIIDKVGNLNLPQH